MNQHMKNVMTVAKLSRVDIHQMSDAIIAFSFLVSIYIFCEFEMRGFRNSKVGSY